jgi:hypothetical protein
MWRQRHGDNMIDEAEQARRRQYIAEQRELAEQRAQEAREQLTRRMAALPDKDPVAEWKREMRELEAEREAADARRRAAEQEHRRAADQRLVDWWATVDARIAQAVEQAIEYQRSVTTEAVGEAIGEMLAPLREKLAELEAVIDKLRAHDAKRPKEQDIDPPNRPWNIN